MKTILETEGRVWMREALDECDLNVFENAFRTKFQAGDRLMWTHALRQAAGITSHLNTLAQDLMRGAKPVRLVSFNKDLNTNWALPWHQDRVIAVNKKIEKTGFSNWSQKSGIWHCEPPAEILNNMFFARVHLDDTDEANGALEIALESHKYGKILTQNIDRIIAQLNTEICSAKRGDVLFVKALTVHRSLVSNSKDPRRVLRIDYADHNLPSPLIWAY